jgi:hypothetical protein
MKLNSTGIESSPEKTVSVSAYGPGPRPISPRRSPAFEMLSLPVDSAVLDGEAILLRSDNTSEFEALRFRQAKQRRFWSPMT